MPAGQGISACLVLPTADEQPDGDAAHMLYAGQQVRVRESPCVLTKVLTKL